MGHESGTKNHAGARGIRKPLDAEIVDPEAGSAGRLTDDEILDTLEKNELNRAQVLARKQVDSAVECLANIMGDSALAPAPRVSAAKELLDRGYGKSSPNRVERPAGGGGGGLKVLILHLSDGTQTEVEPAIDISPVAEDATEVLAQTEAPPNVSVTRFSE